MMWLLLLLSVLLTACSPTTWTHGVPNLAEVSPGVWRSGQPTTAEGWAYLRSIGVKHVVKLNDPSEGSDDGAAAVGLEVTTLVLQPIGDQDVWDDLANAFKHPDGARVVEALTLLARGDDVLVHCTHGQDRTGLVVGLHRVHHDGWTKTQAYKEMLAHHFHPELVGLQSFWDRAP